MVDRVAHAGLRRQVQHPLGLELVKAAAQQRAVGQVAVDEAEPVARVQARQARLFQRRVVVAVEVVVADDLVAVGQQPLGGVVTDEAGGTGDENARQAIRAGPRRGRWSSR